MNLLFSVGAWLTSVLPAVRYWDEIKEDKVCKVDDIIIKVGGIKSGNDKNGMHVVSQVVFYVDRDKVVCHLYNTTQKILVNGHGYKRLIDIFLKPFFQSKVESCSREIENLNKEVSEKYGSKTVKRSSVKYSREPVHISACNVCNSTFKSLSAMNKHRNLEHSTTLNINVSQDLKLPRQSTRNNSFVGNLMMDDITISDLSKSITLDETVPEFKCVKCIFRTTNKERRKEHKEQQHGDQCNEDIKFISILCLEES